MRDIPVNNKGLGYSVKPTEPFHLQMFVASDEELSDQNALESKLFVTRKNIYRMFLGISLKPPLWNNLRNDTNHVYLYMS